MMKEFVFAKITVKMHSWYTFSSKIQNWSLWRIDHLDSGVKRENIIQCNVTQQVNIHFNPLWQNLEIPTYISFNNNVTARILHRKCIHLLVINYLSVLRAKLHLFCFLSFFTKSIHYPDIQNVNYFHVSWTIIKSSDKNNNKKNLESNKKDHKKVLFLYNNNLCISFSTHRHA